MLLAALADTPSGPRFETGEDPNCFDADDPGRLRRRRRRVLFGVVLTALAAIAAWFGLPYVLPVAIDEGPLVQQTTETTAILVWYTTRPADLTVEFIVDGATRSVVSPAGGDRHEVHLSGLPPAAEVPYVILAGDRELHRATLRTNRRREQAFRFVVLGDSGANTPGQYVLAGHIADAAPDFVLHTGDLIYPRGQRSGYASRFFVPYARLIESVSFWPSLGNHDVSKPDFGAPYREVFTLPENGPTGGTPENNYWFDYGAARVVVVDSNVSAADLAAQVAPWLASALDAPSADGSAPLWRFVVFHHPPYTHGAHAPSQSVRTALVPVFESQQVDMVFSGHDHMYERTHPMMGEAVVEPGAGVVYIVSGAGGARLYEPQPVEQRASYFAIIDNRSHSFTRIDVDGPQLELAQIDVAGQVIDHWSYEKALP